MNIHIQLYTVKKRKPKNNFFLILYLSALDRYKFFIWYNYNNMYICTVASAAER